MVLKVLLRLMWRQYRDTFNRLRLTVGSSAITLHEEDDRYKAAKPDQW